MKKSAILWAAVLMLGLFTGCDSGKKPVDPVDSPSSSAAVSTETPVSAAPEMSEEELHRQFELVYNSCGASMIQTEEQLAAELAALKAAADPETSWPEDYEALYQGWRADAIAAQKDLLNEKYEAVISGRLRYDPVDSMSFSGLAYGDLIDLEQDGKPELLLLSWDPGEDYERTVTVELYGEKDGEVVNRWKEDLLIDGMVRSADVSLVRRDGRMFLSVSCEYTPSVGYFEDIDFYPLDGEGGRTAERLAYSYDRTDDSESYTYDGAPIAEAEYSALQKEYVREDMIISVSLFEEPIVNKAGALLAPKAKLNGRTLELSAEPYMWSGDLMAPLRDVLEAMGVAVYANSDASVILASTKNDTLAISNRDFSTWGIDEGYQRYNGYMYSFNGGEPQNIAVGDIDGKAFAPIAAVVTLFGAQAEWGDEDNTLHITCEIPESDRISQSELSILAGFGLDQATQIVERQGYRYYSTGGMSMEDGADDVTGGLAFKHGKAVWELYVVKSGYGCDDRLKDFDGFEYMEDFMGIYVELFRVDVMNDGTVTAYPNDKAWNGAGQV